MPWKAQVCEFCQRRYVNKTGLRNHLSDYTGPWRLPADGIHDVLKVEQVLRRLSPSAYEPDEDCKYKCWTCSAVINSRLRFIEHVIYRAHCGFQPDDLDGSLSVRRLRTWCLPFPEETVLVREEQFPFLRLPLELRLMVYKYLLCFEEINFGKHLHRISAQPHRSGLWLQHNPSNNPLAIMSVNRQVYDEARRTFYGFNMFTFESSKGLPVFLIGIGPENAMLLRAVRCKNKENEYEGKVNDIRSCLMQAIAPGEKPTKGLQTQHTEDLYLKLLSGSRDIPFYWSNNRRLVRPDILDVSAYSERMRYTLNVTLRQSKLEQRETDINATATFELYELTSETTDKCHG